jgi:hypothetical protein
MESEKPIYSRDFSSVANVGNHITTISRLRGRETIDAEERKKIKSLSIIYAPIRTYLK